MSNEQQSLIEVAERLLPERPYQEAVDMGALDRWWRDAFDVLVHRRQNRSVLMPCPFCGSRLCVEQTLDKVDSRWLPGVVECALCGARGPSACDRDKMAAWWNKRAENSTNRESPG